MYRVHWLFHGILSLLGYLFGIFTEFILIVNSVLVYSLDWFIHCLGMLKTCLWYDKRKTISFWWLHCKMSVSHQISNGNCTFFIV